MSAKLTKSVVDRAQSVEKDYFVWDSELKGFGLKVCAGGRKSYVCKYRHGSGRRAPTRRMTIGAHGSPWTADDARREAKRILGLVATGADPAAQKQADKTVLTVAELCEQYLAHGVSTKKPSTLATDRGRIERHVKPLIGHVRLTDMSKEIVSRFMQDIAAGKTATDIKTGPRGRAVVTGGRGTAARTVGLLGGIFSYAIEAGLMRDNPVHGVKRFKDARNMRFLNGEELARLGVCLCDAELGGTNPHAIAILRLLILTGCRKGEIESLRWQDIDFDNGFLRLPDSKTGQTIRPLNGGTIALLNSIPKMAGFDFVFPGAKGKYYVGTPKIWRKIRAAAGLDDVRLHDLRHSFASVAVSGGASLPIIGALLGHKDSATTQRYAHLQDDPVRKATEAAGQTLASFIDDTSAPLLNWGAQQ